MYVTKSPASKKRPIRDRQATGYCSRGRGHSMPITLLFILVSILLVFYFFKTFLQLTLIEIITTCIDKTSLKFMNTCTVLSEHQDKVR